MTLRASTWAVRDVPRLLALVTLCLALLHDFGDYSPLATGLALLAVVLLAVSLRAPRGASAAATAAAIVGCALLQLWYVRWYGWYEAIPATVLTTAAAVACRAQARALRLGATTAAGAASAALVALPWRWGRSGIDAFDFVQGAADEVLHGHNPYSPTWPTYVVFHRESGLSTPIDSHFDYQPAVALLAAPGRLVGDVRLVSVVLFVALFAAAAALAARSGDSARVRTVVLLCAAFPLTTAMVISSWVDVYVLATFAGWLVLRDRHGALAVAALAICLATKPTFAVLLLPYAVWSGRARRDLGVAALAALLLMLPFVVATGPAQFVHDVIGVDFDYPTRLDALTLNSYLYYSFGIDGLPAWAGIAASAAAAVFALRRRPRDHADLLAAAALVALVAFLTAKWAYLNYYFLPAFLLVMAHSAEGLPVAAAWRIGLPVLPTRLRAARGAAPLPVTGA